MERASRPACQDLRRNPGGGQALQALGMSAPVGQLSCRHLPGLGSLPSSRPQIAGAGSCHGRPDHICRMRQFWAMARPFQAPDELTSRYATMTAHAGSRFRSSQKFPGWTKASLGKVGDNQPRLNCFISQADAVAQTQALANV